MIRLEEKGVARRMKHSMEIRSISRKQTTIARVLAGVALLFCVGSTQAWAELPQLTLGGSSPNVRCTSTYETYISVVDGDQPTSNFGGRIPTPQTSVDVRLDNFYYGLSYPICSEGGAYCSNFIHVIPKIYWWDTSCVVSSGYRGCWRFWKDGYEYRRMYEIGYWESLTRTQSPQSALFGFGTILSVQNPDTIFRFAAPAGLYYRVVFEWWGEDLSGHLSPRQYWNPDHTTRSDPYFFYGDGGRHYCKIDG